eukprot:8139774-Alexandrium_andersonii.AAC.1
MTEKWAPAPACAPPPLPSPASPRAQQQHCLRARPRSSSPSARKVRSLAATRSKPAGWGSLPT